MSTNKLGHMMSLGMEKTCIYTVVATLYGSAEGYLPCKNIKKPGIDKFDQG